MKMMRKKIMVKSIMQVQILMQFGNLSIEESSNLDEIISIDAGIGKGIKYIEELHNLNFKNATKGPDNEHWDKAIKAELKSNRCQ